MFIRNIFSISITDTGIEQFFNTVYNIYYYRYSCLKSETIEEIILFLYISRFDFQKTEIKQFEKNFILDKIEISKKQNNKNFQNTEIVSINDNKKEKKKILIYFFLLN